MAQQRDDFGSPAGDDSRRTFMIAGAGALGACVAGVTAAPAVALLTHPVRTPTTSGSDAFLPAGKVAQFAGAVPVKVDLYADKVDAWNRVVEVKIGSAWVMKQGNELRAMSTVCPHLGCAIDYDAQSERFICPCHDSFFSLDGAVQTGPSPRGMDSLEVQTEGDLVAIRYQRFRQGTDDKEPV